MKPWISIALATSAILLALASWLHAATANLLVDDPITMPRGLHSHPAALAQVQEGTTRLNEALEKIQVTHTTPERLRAAFTNYWSERLSLELELLTPGDQEQVRLSIKTAHMKHITALARDLEKAPRTVELQYVAKELLRGAQATEEQF